MGFWYEGWYTDPGRPGVPGWPTKIIIMFIHVKIKMNRIVINYVST